MVREWTAPQRTFLVEKKLLGADLAQIAAEYAQRWPAHTWGLGNAPPHASRRSLNRLLNKFRQKGTVHDLRKRRPSCQEGRERVCKEAMVDQVRAVLDVESARKPDEVGCSVRRNPFNIS